VVLRCSWLRVSFIALSRALTCRYFGTGRQRRWLRLSNIFGQQVFIIIACTLVRGCTSVYATRGMLIELVWLIGIIAWPKTSLASWWRIHRTEQLSYRESASVRQVQPHRQVKVCASHDDKKHQSSLLPIPVHPHGSYVASCKLLFYVQLLEGP
jgi:hypothetical protein